MVAPCHVGRRRGRRVAWRGAWRIVPCRDCATTMARVTPPPETSTVWNHDGETMAVWPGRNYPLGATWSRESTNFAVYAPEARAMWVCLFDEDGVETRHRLTELSLGVWHGALPGVAPGTRYGYRADGPWDPEAGLRFNPAKLLLDPYGRAVSGRPRRRQGHLRLREGRPRDAQRPRLRAVRPPQRRRPRRLPVGPGHLAAPPLARHRDLRDARQGHDRAARPGARGAARDVRRTGDAGRDRLPQGPRRDGGRAAARAPVLLRAGPAPSGAWSTTGATTRCASSPRTTRYSSAGDRGQQVTEFKQMVKDFHLAGLEVILDVVYNHTAEAGPARSDAELPRPRRPRLLPARGAADRAKPGQDPEPVRYWDVTGCGNTVDATHTQSLRMILDSLRYWVTEMHVDGFRFDLMSALTRTDQVVDMGSAPAHRDRAGPRAAPREAGRRAVGRLDGRLPGRASSRRRGSSGTTSSATRCATSGAATPAAYGPSRPGWPGRATSTPTTAARPTPRSTSSPPTTASRCATSCPTTTSTTRPTARTTATAPTTTGRGTAASRARPTTRRSSRCVVARRPT